MSNFAEAARTYASLVRQIRPEQWEGPGLEEWTLRSLVGHTSRSLITVDTYLDQPADTEAATSGAAYYAAIARARTQASSAAVTERGRQAGQDLGDDPAAFVGDLMGRVLPRVERDDDPLIETVIGGMRLSTYLSTRTFELVVHGFDIARAAGLGDPNYPEETLTEVATLAAVAAVLTGQGSAVILALTGRVPLPAGFSVV
jgi:uncharacterized protein (TIGR03083 family)